MRVHPLNSKLDLSALVYASDLGRQGNTGRDANLPGVVGQTRRQPLWGDGILQPLLDAAASELAALQQRLACKSTDILGELGAEYMACTGLNFKPIILIRVPEAYQKGSARGGLLWLSHASLCALAWLLSALADEK